MSRFFNVRVHGLYGLGSFDARINDHNLSFDDNGHARFELRPGQIPVFQFIAVGNPGGSFKVVVTGEGDQVVWSRQVLITRDGTVAGSKKLPTQSEDDDWPGPRMRPGPR